ncbi:MAG TPA: bifunctional metallophosphatase/5'-nucleotidase [Clostridium sp.]|nr:bifunctional metallophosphatase/5'-nucleotidase [Clostridium sp.]
MFKSLRKKKILSSFLALTMMLTFMAPVSVKAAESNDEKEVVILTNDAKYSKTTDDNSIDIQVLTTTDSHGRFLPYDYAINAADNSGSLAQIATKVRELRTENPNTILVDAGDIIQDNSESLFINSSSNPMIEAMNILGYDTMTLGNHEFNYGIPALQRIISQFKGTALCGNVYNSDGSRLAAPYTVIERGGVKVGIIGMVTPNITKWDSANLEGYKVTNPVEETKAAIAELKKQDVSAIVAVDHVGETQEFDQEGSSAIEIIDACPEIDAFVAAHFHVKIAGNYCYNGKTYSLNAADNTVTATTKDGKVTTETLEAYNEAKAKGTVIIEANKWAKTLGQINIKLTKDSNGKYVIANKGNDITTALYDMAPKGQADVESDIKVVDQLQHYSQTAIDDANTPIGELKGGNLVGPDEIAGIDEAKLKPTAMIDLINKVQMYYGEKIANHPIDVSAAAAFKDGANILEGTIKKCDTANIYKFDNTLYVFKLNGAQLKKYMEWSAKYYNTYKDGDLTISFNSSIPGYNYDMFTGVKYDIDISKEPGNRIVNLTKMDGTKITDSDELYLAINNYRASTQLMTNGEIYGEGEELPVLIGKSEETAGLGEGRIRDLIGTYIQEVKGGIIEPVCDNNWSIIGNNWDEAKRAKAVKLINDGTISLAGVSGEQTSENSKAVTWNDVLSTGKAN